MNRENIKIGLNSYKQEKYINLIVRLWRLPSSTQNPCIFRLFQKNCLYTLIIVQDWKVLD